MRVLSTRLQFVYEKLEIGHDVWDLCCDHGYLGIVALKSQKFGHIHFVDQAVHLVEALKARWAQESFARFHAMPAQKLEAPLTGNVVIAGVGGQTISEILGGLKNKGNLKARRLILVPHKDESQLEIWLQENLTEFNLDQRLSVKEGPRVRQVFVLNSANDSRMV